MHETEAVKFLKTVEGNVGIFFHDDTDGCCSAAIVLALLRQRGLKPLLGTGEIDEETFNRFAKEKLDAAIFLDYAVDQYPQWLKHWKGKPVLVIDHHPVTNDLNKLGFLYVNPRLKDAKVYVSASQIVFPICKKAGLEGKDWLERVGGTGDRAIEGGSDEKRATELVDAVKAVEHEDGLVSLAGVLAGLERLDRFIYSEKYMKIHQKYEHELNIQLEKFRAVEMETIIFFETRSNYSLTSSLANRLFEIYPDKTLIIYRCDNRWCKLSSRSRKYDMDKILKEVTAAVGGKGGGHPVAAGAKIPVGKFVTFRKKVIELITRYAGD